MKYDYLIAGSGLYGAVFAYEMKKRGKKCLVIDKRNHIGGNIYCEKIDDINVHKYGAHIFHTSNKKVWEYIFSLEDDLRVAVVLHYYQGFQVKEIAKMLHIPPGTVKSRLFRARNELKKIIEENEERVR